MKRKRARTGVGDGDCRRILAAAQRHGQDDEPDHEVGDLQDALRLCWRRLSPRLRGEVLDEYLLDHPDQNGGFLE